MQPGTIGDGEIEHAITVDVQRRDAGALQQRRERARRLEAPRFAGLRREHQSVVGHVREPQGKQRGGRQQRERAWALVTEHVQSESLRKHLLAVEAAVRGYARAAGEDEEAWGFVALVHDFDYEKYPDRENHPYRGVEILKSLGYPEWVTRAILSHADYSGVPRESALEKTLFACDELSGFITAAALVRPSKSVLDLETSSVVKRMKDKAFARAVPREDIRKGAEEMGLPLETHIANVIGFLRERADALGLRGQL